MADYRQLLALADDEFARVDPLVMNLLVARSIPSLGHLDIDPYRQLRDVWADGICKRLAEVESIFHQRPWDWNNDLNFFRLGIMCEYLDCEVGVAYREDQRDVAAIRYVNPSDLFLNGVMDLRRGTCGNMAALHVSLAWRLGWPVSLACVKSHFICRYDDGKATYNIEATQSGHGGFRSDSDDDLIRIYKLSPKAISTGSDLRAVKPREMLGLFVGLRARHMMDVGNTAEAEKDYLLARSLFPKNHNLYFATMVAAVRRAEEMFDPGEQGSPLTLAAWIKEEYGKRRQEVLKSKPEKKPMDAGYTIRL